MSKLAEQAALVALIKINYVRFRTKTCRSGTEAHGEGRHGRDIKAEKQTQTHFLPHRCRVAIVSTTCKSLILLRLNEVEDNVRYQTSALPPPPRSATMAIVRQALGGCNGQVRQPEKYRAISYTYERINKRYRAVADSEIIGRGKG
jgi:hypothetical protein